MVKKVLTYAHGSVTNSYIGAQGYETPWKCHPYPLLSSVLATLSELADDNPHSPQNCPVFFTQIHSQIFLLLSPTGTPCPLLRSKSAPIFMFT